MLFHGTLERGVPRGEGGGVEAQSPTSCNEDSREPPLDP